jgi:uncharacterized protein (DUF1501 family)
MDLAGGPQHIFDLYGPESRTPGTFAYNCLLARRMMERDVRFVQIFHRGWDQHANLTGHLPNQCRDIDQGCAALIKDLKARGLLDDTLVIWGGEFGRTAYSQGEIRKDNFGRDHHPRCFSIWMAGGGIKPGLVLGATDDFGYNVVQDPVNVHDFHATLLRLLGIDHKQLTYRFEGRDYRLTDVSGDVVEKLLA